MSLILKNVWRSFIRNNQINTTYNVYRFSSSVVPSEAATSKIIDPLMANIKAAPSSIEVLNIVQQHIQIMNHKHMIQVFRTLFELQKFVREEEVEDVVKNPTFGVLCQNLKKKVRALDLNEAVDAVKSLSFLRVPVDSLIFQTLLQIIRHNLNCLNIRQVMFLDFILGKFDNKNHLVDALKLSLPLVFQIHLPLELDNDDLPLLKDMLAYACKNGLPDRFINNIVTGLLIHEGSIDAKTAKAIVWSLCEVNCTQEFFPTRVQLLHTCYDILTQSISQLCYDDVLKTIAKIKGRILEKHTEYYHEQFIDALADYVVYNDIEFEKSLLVARVLSRMAHTNLGILEYLCQQAVSHPNTLVDAHTQMLFGFITCLSNSNFTPAEDQWSEICRQISNNPLMSGENMSLPWPRVCLELASLGYYPDAILTKVFSRVFLDAFLSREDNALDYLQLFTLYEAVKTFHSKGIYNLPEDILKKGQDLYPVHRYTSELEACLARGLGGPEYITKNIVLPNGIVADCLLCLKGGYPIKMPPGSENKKTVINFSDFPQSALIVCVLNFNQGCFSMNSNRLRGTFRLIMDILEQQGYITVPVNLSQWLKVPSHEKTPYLMRELGYRCGEIGIRICTS